MSLAKISLVLKTSHIPQNYVALVHFDYFEVLDIHSVSHTQGEQSSSH